MRRPKQRVQFIVYNPDSGEILRYGSCSADVADRQAHEGERHLITEQALPPQADLCLRVQEGVLVKDETRLRQHEARREEIRRRQEEALNAENRRNRLLDELPEILRRLEARIDSLNS